jgi:hypothetical protein
MDFGHEPGRFAHGERRRFLERLGSEFPIGWVIRQQK